MKSIVIIVALVLAFFAFNEIVLRRALETERVRSLEWKTRAEYWQSNYNAHIYDVVRTLHAPKGLRVVEP